MPISARNMFSGILASYSEGPVHTEVAIRTPGGDTVFAVITSTSARRLELVVGMPVKALVKAPDVMVMVDEAGLRLSARNQLAGTVSEVKRGAVSASVAIELPGGSRVHAIVTNAAADELHLVPGVAATAVFKAGSVMVAV